MKHNITRANLGKIEHIPLVLALIIGLNVAFPLDNFRRSEKQSAPLN